MSTVILYPASKVALKWGGQTLMILSIEFISKSWAALGLTPTGAHLESK